MRSTNPIVAFDHVLKNDWGAGLNPIWQDGTNGEVVWTKMAQIYGIQRAHIPPGAVIAKAIIHYNAKTTQFCGLELLDAQGTHLIKCGNVHIKSTPRVAVNFEPDWTIVGLKSKLQYPGKGAMCHDLQFIIEQVEHI